ncbi:MAG: hypothetical protein M9947_00925 [Thermomicrobiales bacterium]|nr:hypothetical protein [Thermomicrobiales bacterium]
MPKAAAMMRVDNINPMITRMVCAGRRGTLRNPILNSNVLRKAIQAITSKQIPSMTSNMAMIESMGTPNISFIGSDYSRDVAV